jgi:hypothetical protein
MRGYQRLVNKTVQIKACIAIALKGLNEKAQGNALGKGHTKTPSPERAKGVVKWLLRPFRAFLMGDLLPGVALRSTPGYLISPLRGLRSTARHCQLRVCGVPFFAFNIHGFPPTRE